MHIYIKNSKDIFIIPIINLVRYQSTKPINSSFFCNRGTCRCLPAVRSCGRCRVPQNLRINATHLEMMRTPSKIMGRYGNIWEHMGK